MVDQQKTSKSTFPNSVVSDPKRPPDVVLLWGFVGESSEEDHARLYSDAQLSQYVEIPKKAIVFRHDVEAGVSPLGGSYLWVRRDAEITCGRADGVRWKTVLTSQVQTGNQARGLNMSSPYPGGPCVPCQPCLPPPPPCQPCFPPSPCHPCFPPPPCYPCIPPPPPCHPCFPPPPCHPCIPPPPCHPCIPPPPPCHPCFPPPPCHPCFPPPPCHPCIPPPPPCQPCIPPPPPCGPCSSGGA
jgi:hypothetical protein